MWDKIGEFSDRTLTSVIGDAHTIDKKVQATETAFFCTQLPIFYSVKNYIKQVDMQNELRFYIYSFIKLNSS